MDFGGDLVLKTSPTLVYVQSAQPPFDSGRVILDSSVWTYKKAGH